MKNKKLFSIILSVCILFCSLSVAAFAEEKAVSVDVYLSDDYIDQDNLLYKGMYTIIGRRFNAVVRIKGIENISEFVFEIDYNDTTLSLYEYTVNCVSSDVNYRPMMEKKSDEPLILRVYDKNGIADTSLFSIGFCFQAEEKGRLDFDINVLSLIDGDGNSYEPEVNIKLPSETHYSEDIPNALPDFDISLSYGFSNYIKTELAYPMTVNEFVSKLKNAESCNAEMVTADGKVLDGDAFIPTGAKLKVTFDTMPVFSSTMILIGDVNGDTRITAADARIVLRYTAKIDRNVNSDTFSVAANAASDTREINAADAREILRISAGIGKTYDELYSYHCLLERSNRFLINDNLK